MGVDGWELFEFGGEVVLGEEGEWGGGVYVIRLIVVVDIVVKF